MSLCVREVCFAWFSRWWITEWNIEQKVCKRQKEMKPMKTEKLMNNRQDTHLLVQRHRQDELHSTFQMRFWSLQCGCHVHF